MDNYLDNNNYLDTLHRLSIQPKPMNVENGKLLIEEDTGKTFIFIDGEWFPE